MGRRGRREYDSSVFKALTMVSQFTINLLVPIALMSIAGYYLDKHFGSSIWMIIFFFVGAIAGGRNIYLCAKGIINEKDDDRGEDQ